MTVAAGVTVILVCAFVFYLLRLVIVPFGIAGALAFLAAPLVRWLHSKHGWSHALAAAFVYVVYLLLIGLFGAVCTFIVAPQIANLLQHAPETIEHLLTAAFRGQTLHAFGQTYSAKQISAELVGKLSSFLHNPSALIFVGTASIASIVAFFLTLALLGFLLFQGRQLAQGALWLFPPQYRDRVEMIAAELEPVVYNYVRGIIVIAAYGTVVTAIVGLIMHLPHALLIALAVGLLEMIPMVGPALALALLGIVVAERATPELLIGFAIFAAGLRLSIDNLIAPLVLGKSVSLPPVVIMFAFLAGGALFGMVGVILAIPVAAAIKVVLADVYGERETTRPLLKQRAALHPERASPKPAG